MTPPELAAILSTVPEHRLAILDLARALTGPDGGIDLQRAEGRAAEVAAAQREQHAYTSAVSTLGKSLMSMQAVPE